MESTIRPYHAGDIFPTALVNDFALQCSLGVSSFARDAVSSERTTIEANTANCLLEQTGPVLLCYFSPIGWTMLVGLLGIEPCYSHVSLWYPDHCRQKFRRLLHLVSQVVLRWINQSPLCTCRLLYDYDINYPTGPGGCSDFETSSLGRTGSLGSRRPNNE